MCVGDEGCTLLGRLETWSRRCPLPVPTDLSAGFVPLTQAVERARSGELELSRALLTEVDSSRLQSWYVLHAQHAGLHRYRALGSLSRPASIRSDSRRIPSSFTRQIYERDRYTCRYCHQRLIATQVFTALRNRIGQDFFPMGRGNYARHGARLVFGISVDHVIPHSQGGPTTPGNLVTSCWPCNFGKAEFAPIEIGLDDPRDRDPVASDWRGLLVPARAASA